MPSDLDKQLLKIVGGDLPEHEKCEKILRILDIDRRWTEFGSTESRLDKNIPYGKCHNPHEVSFHPYPAIGVAAYKKQWSVVALLMDHQFDYYPALYVTMKFNNLDLTREIFSHTTDLVNFDREIPSLDNKTLSSLKLTADVSTLIDAYKHLKSAIEFYQQHVKSPFQTMPKLEEKKEIKGLGPSSKVRSISELIRAFNVDRELVYLFLVDRLHQIHTKKETEKQSTYLPDFTKILFNVLNDELHNDSKEVNEFEERLASEWPAYLSHEIGYFKTEEELREFYTPLIKNKPSFTRFASASDLKLMNAPSIEEKALSRMVPKRSGFFRSQQSFDGNFIEQFMRQTKRIQSHLIDNFNKDNKGEGFNIGHIVRSLPLLTKSLGIDESSYALVLVKPLDLKQPHLLVDQLHSSLIDENRKKNYLLVAIQTGKGGHAVALFIDRKEKQVVCVDPAGNEFKGHDEAILSVNELMKHSALSGGTLITPKSYQKYPQKGEPDNKFCAGFVKWIFIALLCKSQNKKLHSTNHEITRVYDSLEIDVEACKLPLREFQDTYLGISIMAHNKNLDLDAVSKAIDTSPMMKMD